MKFLLYILSAILGGFAFLLFFGFLYLIGVPINDKVASTVIYCAALGAAPLLYNYLNKTPDTGNIEDEWEQAQQAEQKYRNRPHKNTPHDT